MMGWTDELHCETGVGAIGDALAERVLYHEGEL